MRLFDTHAHIGLMHKDPIEQLLVIQQAKRAGVEHIVSICNTLNDFEIVYGNLRSSKSTYHAVGVSPTEAGNFLGSWESKVLSYGKYDRVVAIGETGLDYEKYAFSRFKQVELFLKHLEIARRLDLPVIIHNRNAHDDILDILRSKIPGKGAIFHCYSGDWASASKALDLQVWFSFAGNITFRNSKGLHQALANLPADRILIESESPFLAPFAFRGQRNRPANISETLNAVAQIRGVDPNEMAEIIYLNSLKAFGLDENA